MRRFDEGSGAANGRNRPILNRLLPVRFWTVLVVGVVACASSSDLPSHSSDTAVVAVVGKRVITKDDFERGWRAQAPVAYLRARHGDYEVRRQALDAVVGEHLVRVEAENLGLSVEALFERVAEDIEPVAEAEIQAVYADSDADEHGVTLDESRPVIVEYLEQQRRLAARESFVGRLRGATGVRILLEPPRETIPVTADDPVRGGDSAAIRIIEFSDFECPFCREASPVLQRLHSEYSAHVQWVWKDYPAEVHEAGQRAAEAAQCAHEQGEFWAYRDLAFDRQSDLQANTAATLLDLATTLRLDTRMFAECLDTGRRRESVAADVAVGRQVGVGATPTVFINGRMVWGARPFEAYERIVLDELELSGIQN